MLSDASVNCYCCFCQHKNVFQTNTHPTSVCVINIHMLSLTFASVSTEDISNDIHSGIGRASLRSIWYLCYQQMSHVPFLLLCFQEAGNDCKMQWLHLLSAFNSVGSRREANSTQLFNRLHTQKPTLDPFAPTCPHRAATVRNSASESPSHLSRLQSEVIC